MEVLPPMSETLPSPEEDSPETPENDPVVEPPPTLNAVETALVLEEPTVEASVWRLSPGGNLISSVIERHAGAIAEMEPNTIYFYADLGGVDKLTNTDETMQKVYQALSSVGLTEGQIVNATNAMQAAGVLFRERAV